MKKVLVVVAALVLATSTGAFAATQAANATSVQPTLQISANIQKAVSLTLKTGTGANHCTVAAGGSTDYSMDFGTVDALAISTPTCGNKIAPTVPGTDNAIYWTDYQVVPVFTSHQTFSGTTVTAQVKTDFAAPHNIFVVRTSDATQSSAPSVAGDFAAMTVASDDTLASSVTSGTALTRFIGVAVKPDNGNTVLQGNQSATVQFTITVQ